MQIAALAGGVGAARLVSGLAAVMPAEDLSIVVNTGDDFDWMGLYVCPDLDTIIYTLAGLANPAAGWGMRDDTFRCLDRLRELNGDDWFMIGDVDLATHILRTQLSRSGNTLSDITKVLCERNGLRVRVLPMTDNRVPTRVHTGEGTLEFQDYFVRRKCAPRVLGFSYDKVEESCPAPGVVDLLRQADAVIVCPSNPFISIGPILAVPGIRQALRETSARVLAISPVIAGRAIKGPAATMLCQMGLDVSAASVAALYRDFLDVFVLDEKDKDLTARVEAFGIQVQTAQTLMNDTVAKIGLAWAVVEMLR